MLSCLTKRPLYINKNLSDYFTKTTNESIRKLTEKNNLERNKQQFKKILDEDDNSGKPEFNFYGFLLFLSTLITFHFTKRLN